MARMLRERGVGRCADLPRRRLSVPHAARLGRLEADPDIDWVGLNLYRPPEEYRPLAIACGSWPARRACRSCRSSGPGCGATTCARRCPSEEEFVTLSGLMYGIKAFNFYMLVERERWQGSPITRHGEYRTGVRAVLRSTARLSEALRVLAVSSPAAGAGAARVRPGALRRGELGARLRPRRPAALPWALFDGAPDLGFRWDVVREAQLRDDSWPRRVMAALRSRLDRLRPVRYAYRARPTAALPGGLPAGGRLHGRRRSAAAAGVRARRRAGRGWAQACPYLDEHLRPKRVLAEHATDPGEVSFGAGHLVWATDQDVVEWVRRLVRPAEFQVDDTRLEVVPHDSQRADAAVRLESDAPAHRYDPALRGRADVLERVDRAARRSGPRRPRARASAVHG